VACQALPIRHSVDLELLCAEQQLNALAGTCVGNGVAAPLKAEQSVAGDDPAAALDHQIGGTRPAELESAALEFIAYILGLGLGRKRCDAFARGVVRKVAQRTDGARSQGDRCLSIEGKFDQRICQWA
jgi:hypothetical protein